MKRPLDFVLALVLLPLLALPRAKRWWVVLP